MSKFSSHLLHGLAALLSSSALFGQVSFATTLQQTDSTQEKKQTEERILVNAKLQHARASIQPGIGASKIAWSRKAIEANPGGENAPLSSLLIQAPSVAQDSYGQVHIRGDHNGIQFRLDGVALPEGLSVFSQALQERFVNSMTLLTGALPAEYGFREAGVIEINTKNGFSDPGVAGSVYGGARDYFQPSLQAGGNWGKWDAYFTGNYIHNRVGLENPTPKFNAPHDLSNQYYFLGHVRFTANDHTRLSWIGGIANAWYQLPNNPGLQRQFATLAYRNSDNVSNMALHGTPESTDLNSRQGELTDFSILSWQERRRHFNAVTSAVVRYSSLHYNPDWPGELVYNGIAQHARRSVISAGIQNDFNWHFNKPNHLRGGFQVYGEGNNSSAFSHVFSKTGEENDKPVWSQKPVNLYQKARLKGYLLGIYLQDEWKILQNLTLNSGLRFDQVNEGVKARQLSPRINLVWQPVQPVQLHIGYSRYFTPPPFEAVTNLTVSQFVNTSGAAPGSIKSDPAKAERNHYFDVGATITLNKHWHMGVDSYYKRARNLLDLGQFGSPVMFTAFNYPHGRAYGVEFTTDYQTGGLSLYGNMAYGMAKGKGLSSAQWSFSPEDMHYISQHWVPLDHSERWTASAGAEYNFFRNSWHPLHLSGSMVYGSGLRKDIVTPDGKTIPNGGTMPRYAVFNLSVFQDFMQKNWLYTGSESRTRLRLDVYNLFDRTYAMRDGTGIGVGAPQYGMRRTILVGLSQSL